MPDPSERAALSDQPERPPLVEALGGVTMEQHARVIEAMADANDEVARLRAALEKIAAIPTVRLRGEGKDHHGEIVSVREAVDVAREALNGGDA